MYKIYTVVKNVLHLTITIVVLFYIASFVFIETNWWTDIGSVRLIAYHKSGLVVSTAIGWRHIAGTNQRKHLHRLVLTPLLIATLVVFGVIIDDITWKFLWRLQAKYLVRPQIK